MKPQLLEYCKQYIESRIATAKQSMDEAQQAANEESKSTVGDKYETTRAMMQIERDKAAGQLDEAIKLKNVVDQLSADVQHDKVGLGSLVITDSRKIFISIGIGKISLDGDEFLVVAPTSPLGKACIGLKVNEQIMFNKERLTILKIC